MRLGNAVYECCMQQSVLLGNTGREGVLLAALSAAGQDRLRQCMNAAPAKNAARLHRQKLPTIMLLEFLGPSMYLVYN